jgi:hypothetical protein
MSGSGQTRFPRETPLAPEDPLVPLLPLEGDAPDPVALSTWHLALSSTTAVEVPHDLFALWLYPATGGVVLLGPEALAQDRVTVPIPDPILMQDQLFELEEVLRKAKYASAIAVPVRSGDRDTAVMLLGSFSRGAFGSVQALALHRLAGQLGGSIGALAQVMSAAAPHAAVESEMTLETLPTAIARAAAEATGGADLVRRVSGVLYPLLPHDRLEVLVSALTEGAFLPLSGQAPRRRWGAGGATVEPFADIIARFGRSPTLTIDDLSELEPPATWVLGTGTSDTPTARAVLAARLDIAGQTVGYLVMGSVAREAFRPEDEDTLAMAALLIAARVSNFRMVAESAGLRAQIDTGETPSLPLIRSAEALAATGHLGEALSRFSLGMKGLLPHDRISLHLRWGEDDVIELNVNSPRPFADIPAVPIDAFPGAPILRGEREWVVQDLGDAEEVMVALNVAGKAIGTLGVQGRGFAGPREAAGIAQQFANILAPHLELLRRGAASNGPGARGAIERRSLVGEL